MYAQLGRQNVLPPMTHPPPGAKGIPPGTMQMPPLGKKISHSRTKDNRRGRSIHDWYWYDPLPSRQFPGKFKYRTTNAGVPTGELVYSERFKGKSDFLQYMDERLTHGIQPRLWIQNTPAAHNNRYISEQGSHKCHFQNCAIDSYSIRKGYHQVSVDEHPDETGYTYDPFHVAFFVHLFCLEQQIPLLDLMFEYNYDVRPDLRQLPLEEKNPMSLDRDGEDRLGPVFWDWVDWCLLYQSQHGESPSRKEDYLSHWLADAHVRKQSDARQITREKRNGTDIAKTRGNLTEYQAAKAKQKLKKQEAAKRQREDDDGNDYSDDDYVRETRVKRARHDHDGVADRQLPFTPQLPPIPETAQLVQMPFSPYQANYYHPYPPLPYESAHPVPPYGYLPAQGATVSYPLRDTRARRQSAERRASQVGLALLGESLSPKRSSRRRSRDASAAEPETEFAGARTRSRSREAAALTQMGGRKRSRDESALADGVQRTVLGQLAKFREERRPKKKQRVTL